MNQLYLLLAAAGVACFTVSLIILLIERSKWRKRADGFRKSLKAVQTHTDARTAKLLTFGKQTRNEFRKHIRAREEEIAILKAEILRLGEKVRDQGRWSLSTPGIIINTLPKVGSSSIRVIAERAFPEALIVQTHSVSVRGRQALLQDMEACGQTGAYNDLATHWHLGMRLQQHLTRLGADAAGYESLYHICGTREPIAWALSLVFQLAAMDAIPGMPMDCHGVRRIIMDWHQGHPLLHWTPWPDDWMRREISEPLEVNPLGMPFDAIRGYQIYNTKKGRLLLYRIESFGRIAPALAELFSAPPSLFQHIHEHGTRDKPVGRAYEEVASRIKFPPAFVEKVYSEPYAATFYTEEERASFIQRWIEQ